MHEIIIGFEYLAGIVGALAVLLSLLVAFFVGLFEVPRYIRIRSM